MYIHEHKNWWLFRYDTEKVISVLGAVRARQGRLLGRLSALGIDVQNRTMLDAMSLDVIKSSEIEGEKLEHSSVRSSIARRLGLDTAGLPSPSHYIEGIIDMMMDATQNHSQPLTDERLFGWHGVLFPTGRSGLYAIDVARYRTGDMQVVSGAMGKEHIHYQAPSAERVHEDMCRFLQWINSEEATNDIPEGNGMKPARIDPVIKAAIAHLWFVTIHPFDDGNGRIGRAITDMLMARADGCAHRFYSMSDAICSAKAEYYNILERTQHGNGEITEWMLWFIHCLDMALEKAESTISSATAKQHFWTVNNQSEFNARQQKIINMLLDSFDGNLTTGRWSRICHCSRDTALADVTDLISKGVMQKASAGGRSTNYLLVQPHL